MKKILFTLSGSGLLMMPAVAFAQTIVTPSVKATRFEDFIGYFDTLIAWLFTILLILAVIFIILAAFKYLTAAGDEEKIKGAHRMIIYAVVGLVVAFLAQSARYIVQQLLS